MSYGFVSQHQDQTDWYVVTITNLQREQKIPGTKHAKRGTYAEMYDYASQLWNDNKDGLLAGIHVNHHGCLGRKFGI